MKMKPLVTTMVAVATVACLSPVLHADDERETKIKTEREVEADGDVETKTETDTEVDRDHKAMRPGGGLHMFDANSDGMLDADEIAGAPQVLVALDKDGDGKVSAMELRGPRARVMGKGKDREVERKVEVDRDVEADGDVETETEVKIEKDND